MAKIKIEKPFTIAQTVTYLAAETGLTQHDIRAVLRALEGLIFSHLKKKGVQKFNFLGLAQFRVERVARRAERKGRNPATGEEITISAKPAHDQVKARVLKKMREIG